MWCSSAGTASRAITRCSTPPPARRARRAASARCPSTRCRSTSTCTRSPARSACPPGTSTCGSWPSRRPGAEPVLSDESLDLRWFGWDALPAGALAELPRLIEAARRRLAALSACSTRRSSQLDEWPVPRAAAAVVGPAGVLSRARPGGRAVPAGVGDQAARRAGHAGRGRGGARSSSTDPADERLHARRHPAPPARPRLRPRAGAAAAVVRAGRAARLLQRRASSSRPSSSSAAAEMPFADYFAEALVAPLRPRRRRRCPARRPRRRGVGRRPRSRASTNCSSPTGLLQRADARRGLPRCSTPACAACCPGSASQDPTTGGWASRSAATSRRTGPVTTNSPATFGHFGQSGTMFWVDPAAGLGLVALAERDFGPWAARPGRACPTPSSPPSDLPAFAGVSSRVRLRRGCVG